MCLSRAPQLPEGSHLANSGHGAAPARVPRRQEHGSRCRPALRPLDQADGLHRALCREELVADALRNPQGSSTPEPVHGDLVHRDDRQLPRRQRLARGPSVWCPTPRRYPHRDQTPRMSGRLLDRNEAGALGPVSSQLRQRLSASSRPFLRRPRAASSSPRAADAASTSGLPSHLARARHARHTFPSTSDASLPKTSKAAAERLDFSRAAIDSSHVPAKRGRSRPRVGPSPVDRARPGSKHHVVTDARGTPLRVSLTGGHRNDVTELLPLVDEVPPVRGKRGRPRRRPRALYADRGYDHDIYRHRLRERGITPKIARRGQPHGSGLGRARWVAESAIAHLHGLRRLRIRWEARDDMHDAFLQLAH